MPKSEDCITEEETAQSSVERSTSQNTTVDAEDDAVAAGAASVPFIAIVSLRRRKTFVAGTTASAARSSVAEARMRLCGDTRWPQATTSSVVAKIQHMLTTGMRYWMERAGRSTMKKSKEEM
jgi:hypothetical protein